MQPMRKILILTAGFGNGHNAAAFNLRDGLDAVSEDVQVEVLDLFKICYGKTNDLVKKLFLGVVEHAPSLWGGVYSFLDRTSILEKQMGRFSKLQAALREILMTAEPDVVISTYPAYNYVIDRIYKDHQQRPFSQLTIITDSISINSVWYGAPSDYFFVPNQLSADVLIKAGIPAGKVLAYGFPVSPRFHELADKNSVHCPNRHEPRKILYIINNGKKKAGKIIEQLMGIPNVRLTITCGADADLKGRLIERTAHLKDWVNVLGWTNQMPEILAASHLVITKAGGAVVQEAIAARCPLIINQVIPGQEAGNAELVKLLDVGGVVEDDHDLVGLVHAVFENNGKLWSKWRTALKESSRPDSSLRIAEFILNECLRPDSKPGLRQTVFGNSGQPETPGAPAISQGKKSLLCDFHTHTNYSDGKLTVSELVDFYGARNFDCVCITDHLAEKRRLMGRLANLSNLTLPWGQVREYFEVIEHEKKRAWKKYSMLLLAGLEFNKDGFTRKSSAHLLGIDLKAPIHPDLEMKELIEAIHGQGALAVASHPHEMKSEWGKNTLYFWENQEEYAPLLDAWEIANRNNLFNPVGLKRLPFLANSDFHKPRHIYSWKTLLNCEKEPEAIKQCIRENRDISITLYRDPGLAGEQPNAFREARDSSECECPILSFPEAVSA